MPSIALLFLLELADDAGHDDCRADISLRTIMSVCCLAASDAYITRCSVSIPQPGSFFDSFSLFTINMLGTRSVAAVGATQMQRGSNVGIVFLGACW